MDTCLGAKILRHRKEKGYSLDKLAALAGTSKSYLWEIENQRDRKPSGEKLSRIALALGVSTDYLLNEDEHPGLEAERDALFSRFKRLGAQDQKRILQMIDFWSVQP